MKKIFLISLMLLFFTSFSQSKSEKLKAISIIESLSYEETIFMGLKIINSCKVNYDDDTKKVEFILKSLYPDGNSSIIKYIFYIDDLDLNTLEENIIETEKYGLFINSIRVKAKGKLIRQDVIEENKINPLENSSKTKYGEYIAIFPGMKALPREHAERFNLNVKILLLD